MTIAIDEPLLIAADSATRRLRRHRRPAVRARRPSSVPPRRVQVLLAPPPPSCPALPLPAWKRAMDIAGALIGLLFATPLFLLIALAVRLSGPGPILFHQRRAGLSGRPFVMYKFRTMVPDAEARKVSLLHLSEQAGPAFKMKRDPRVTRIGRFLRSTSLDELPQFLNVLKGEMSLVGPRPLPLDETADCQPHHLQRLAVTPGITCIWQISGRGRVSFEQWLQMDLHYIRNRSPLFDLFILVKTIPAVLSRRGAQ